MRVRTAAGRFLIRFGRFVQSLAVAVMRPDDLIEFSRGAYSKSEAQDFWGDTGTEAIGLDPAEQALLDRLPARGGRALVLGMGGGREAILLAKLGFEVTGVDFVPSLVRRAERNAAERGVGLKTLVQDISKLEVPPGMFDLVTLFAAMYSCVPTRGRRVAMLKRIRAALGPGGFFLCGYQYLSPLPSTPKADRLRRLFAWLTLGNTRLEKGDMIWREAEFIHAFWSADLLRAEFEEGGFEVVDLGVPVRSLWGYAILRNAGKAGGADV